MFLANFDLQGLYTCGELGFNFSAELKKIGNRVA